MGTVLERFKLAMKKSIAPDIVEAQLEGTITAPAGTSENPADKLLTFANFITICRFVLTVLFLVLYIRGGSMRTVAVGCYIAAAISDFLDEWVARATQTVSWFGKVSDPIMDIVLLFIGVIGLVAIGDLPLWVAVFVIGRDLILLGGNMYLRKFWTRPVDVIFIGKLGTALFMTGFCFLLVRLWIVDTICLLPVSWLPGFNGEPVSVGIYMIYIAIILSTITAVIYYKQGFAIKAEVLARRAAEQNR